MTSDSAFKGLYCTELRSLQDNGRHPVAIQTFFTTLSSVPFFPLSRFLSWQSRRTMGKSLQRHLWAPYLHMTKAILSHLPILCFKEEEKNRRRKKKKNEPWIDFPTITVVELELRRCLDFNKVPFEKAVPAICYLKSMAF